MLGGPEVGLVLGVETPTEEVLDINTPRDLEYARWMLSQRPLAAAI